MNKNLTPIILIVLALGIYFTFTRVKINELKEIQVVNAQYEQALKNSEELIKIRDQVLAAYNEIDPLDRDRLNKMLPDNVDNVRLIIDVNGVASRHGLSVKNIKTNTEQFQQSDQSRQQNQQVVPIDGGVGMGEVYTPATYNKVTLTFDVSANYSSFVNFIRDLESSLRIMDITKIDLTKGEGIETYDFGVEVTTYWLRQ